MLCSTSKGVCSGPPPRLAVGGLARRKEHGLTLTLTDVYYVKPMCPSGEHGRGYHPAPGGSVSREKRDRGHTTTRTRTTGQRRAYGMACYLVFKAIFETLTPNGSRQNRVFLEATNALHAMELVFLGPQASYSSV